MRCLDEWQQRGVTGQGRFSEYAERLPANLCGRMQGKSYHKTLSRPSSAGRPVTVSMKA